MKRILQKINQRFELNFVFALQFSEHEEDELFKIIQVYISEFGTSSGHRVVPLSLVIQDFKITWL